MGPPIRASSITRSVAVKADQVVDTVTLDHEARYRRRAVLSCAGGLEVLLDLDKPERLEDGDALKLDDGRLVRVVAAPEEPSRSCPTIRRGSCAPPGIWAIGTHPPRSPAKRSMSRRITSSSGCCAVSASPRVP